ncbi:MAG: hypothetical protein M0009_10765 [Deltaproteobacteria bacterium]|nr:hypothetical protein [Deltaproteobacteria bacterium]
MSLKPLIAALVLFLVLAGLPARADALQAWRAMYGWKKWADVTGKFNALCQGKDPCHFEANNGNFGDPDYGEDKFLRVWFYPGAPQYFEFPEGSTGDCYTAFGIGCKRNGHDYVPAYGQLPPQ